VRTLLLFAALLLTTAASPIVNVVVSGSGPYSGWSSYPQSASFFPLSVWRQNPNIIMGSGAPYSTQPAAMLGTGMNIYLDADNGAAGSWSPTGFGAGDQGGGFSTIYNAGLYFIPQISVGAGSNCVAATTPTSGACVPNQTANNSIASIEALASSVGHLGNIIGWNLGDEPESVSCTNWPMSAIPGQVATVKVFDSTRPLFLNSTNYIFNSGICNPSSLNSKYMAAISVGSMDDYPNTDPWHISCCTGTPLDQMWRQGWTIHQMMAQRAPGAPFWAAVETGTDELAFSSQNGFTCTPATETCTKGSVTIEERATPAQVDAEVWLSIINGATGITYFCDDSTGYSVCLGQTGSALAMGIQANLAYINSQITAWAPEINATTVGACTMISGTSYSNFTTSCSNGSLSVSTGNSSMPASAMLKSYGGKHYLFAQPARNGTGALAFIVSGAAGGSAVIAYDSDSHYDAANSSLGTTIPIDSSGQFIDTFGANGDNYEVKIYQITP